MRQSTITVDIDLDLVTCANCGMVFAFSSKLMQERRRDHKEFWCPSGHSNYFPGESDLERLERELREARVEIKRADYRAQSARMEREAAERQLRTTKGQVTKLRKRIANGVCPCCHRSFTNLQRHMTTKHPKYVEEETNP